MANVPRPSLETDPWDLLSVCIRYANVFACKPAWNIGPMELAHYGLLLVVQGVGWTQCNQDRFEALPGDLFLWSPSQRISAGHDPQRPLTVLSTGFDLWSPGQYAPLSRLTLPQRMRLPAADRPMIERLYASLIESFNEPGSTSKLAARGALLQLLAQVIALSRRLPAELLTGSQQAREQDDPRVAQVVAYIDSHLARKLSLAQLAQQVHLTPAHFAQLFRRWQGQSPMAYVRQKRVDKARELLAQGQDKVEVVARAVGFDDPYHFSRVFRQLVGVPPGRYAAAIKNPMTE